MDEIRFERCVFGAWKEKRQFQKMQTGDIIVVVM
jgi:hypothetical protein